MITYLHDNAIMHVVKIPIEDEFQALSDSTRLRIVRLMAVTNEEACLCELVDSLLEPQYKLSRHLKILRQAGLLDSEKEGRWVYHRLSGNTESLRDLLGFIVALSDHKDLFASDLARFQKRLEHREDGRCRVGVLTHELESNAV